MTINVRLPRKLNKAIVSGQLTEAARLHPVGALGITLNMLPLHRASMTLAETDEPLAMHDLVELYSQNGSVGVFRVNRITNTYKHSRQIELSHGLDVFADSQFETIEEFSGTVAAYVQKIISAQTQAIDGIPYWQLGTVEDTNLFSKDIKHDNLLECLTEIARTEEDYVFTFDQSSFPWTLNFVARDSTVLSEFRLSRNTETCAVTLDDADLCTRLHLSVTTETTESITDDDGIVHVAGKKTQEGYYTYNDTAAQAIWGIVTKSAGVLRKDVPTDTALSAWVASYFARHNTPAVQITITGQELNQLTGVSIDEMHISRICRIALPDYNTTFEERIVSIVYPDALRTPYSIKVNLANKKQTAEGSFAEIRQAASKAGGSARGAKAGADNTATDEELQKIRYNLQVVKDNKRFAVIADEEWYDDMYGSHETLIGKYDSNFEVTARKLTSAFNVTGVALDEDGNPIMDGDDYVFNGSGNTLSSQITQTASLIRTEVSAAKSTMWTTIEQTATEIRTEVGNSVSGLQTQITQTANEIRSEVSNSLSGLVTYIDQQDNAIRQVITHTAHVYTQLQDPLSDEGGGILPAEGDMWIKDGDIHTWADVAGKTWAELSEDYEWRQLAGASGYVWLNGKWEPFVDHGGALLQGTRIDQTEEHIALQAGDIRGMYGELEVTSRQIRTELIDARNDLGSSITQTASQIRAEVHAQGSQLYSSIEQTATQIRAEVSDSLNSMGSSITQTASQIRSEVHSQSSTLYSAIQQTATQIRAEVSDSNNSLKSTITQTASQIRSEVSDSNNSLASSITQTASQIRSEVHSQSSTLYTAIEQTATQIRSEVADTKNSLRSEIVQNSSQIALKVNNGDVATQLAVEAGNVRISGGNLIIDGYIRSDSSYTGTLYGGKISISGGDTSYITGSLNVSETGTFHTVKATQALYAPGDTAHPATWQELNVVTSLNVNSSVRNWMYWNSSEQTEDYVSGQKMITNVSANTTKIYYLGRA